MNRVVTGFDENGNPVVIRQGEPPVVIRAGRYTTTELWVSERGPILAAGIDASTREWAPHDWQNRSSEPAVMVGVLLSAG